MLRGSEPIIHHGNVIGVTTSCGYGFSVAKTIAYGYVPISEAGHGDQHQRLDHATEFRPIRGNGSIEKTASSGTSKYAAIRRARYRLGRYSPRSR